MDRWDTELNWIFSNFLVPTDYQWLNVKMSMIQCVRYNNRYTFNTGSLHFMFSIGKKYHREPMRFSPIATSNHLKCYSDFISSFYLYLFSLWV